jgi:hypothetical protein
MNYFKKSVIAWAFYALGYSLFRLYGIFEGKLLPTFICWLTLMIIAIVYDDGEISTKEVAGVAGNLMEIIGATLALIFFPIIVFGEKPLALIKKNSRIIVVTLKKVTAGILLFIIFDSFYLMINHLWQLSPLNTVCFAAGCFTLSGIILFLYTALVAPIIAGWFTQKIRENNNFSWQIINQFVIAMHIGFLLPIVWLTDD